MAINYQGLRCYYCGDQAEDRDHVVPKASKIKLKRKERKRVRREVMDSLGRNTVPACRACNVLKGDILLEQFRAELNRCLPRSFYRSGKEMKTHRLALRLEEFGMKFYGERGTVDGVFPIVNQSQPFTYKWKAKAPRNTGKIAVRIEECAKRGQFTEVQGGLVNQG